MGRATAARYGWLRGAGWPRLAAQEAGAFVAASWVGGQPRRPSGEARLTHRRPDAAGPSPFRGDALSTAVLPTMTPRQVTPTRNVPLIGREAAKRRRRAWRGSSSPPREPGSGAHQHRGGEDDPGGLAGPGAAAEHHEQRAAVHQHLVGAGHDSGRDREAERRAEPEGRVVAAGRASAESSLCPRARGRRGRRAPQLPQRGPPGRWTRRRPAARPRRGGRPSRRRGRARSPGTSGRLQARRAGRSGAVERRFPRAAAPSSVSLPRNRRSVTNAQPAASTSVSATSSPAARRPTALHHRPRLLAAGEPVRRLARRRLLERAEEHDHGQEERRPHAPRSARTPQGRAFGGQNVEPVDQDTRSERRDARPGRRRPAPDASPWAGRPARQPLAQRRSRPHRSLVTETPHVTHDFAT